MTDNNNDENIHIGELFKQIFGYWRIYVPIGLICLVAAIVFLLVTPKEYAVTSRMQLLSNQQGIMSEMKMLRGAGVASLFGSSASGLISEDEILLMKSRINLLEVIKNNDLQISTTVRRGLKKITLDKDESPLAFTFPTSFLDTLSAPITLKTTLRDGRINKMIIKSILFDKIQLKNQSLPLELVLPVGEISIKDNLLSNGTYTTTIQPLQLTFEELEENVDIYPSETMSNIIELYIRSANKYQARKILNNIMNEYNNYSRNVKLVESNLNADFVRNRLDTITTELAFLEHQIEKYKQGNKMPDINAHVSLIYYGNQEAEQAILGAETRLRMLNYVIDYMENPANQFSAIPIIDGAGEQAIALYNESLLDRQRLLISSEPNNPALQLAEKQLEEQRKMLLETVKSVRNNVLIRLETLREKDTKLTNLLDKLPKQEREFIEMKRQQRIKESIYLFLMQKLQEQELANSPDELAGRIVDKAYSSYKHVFPKGKIILIIAFAVACMLSLAIIGVKLFMFNKKQ